MTKRRTFQSEPGVLESYTTKGGAELLLRKEVRGESTYFAIVLRAVAGDDARSEMLLLVDKKNRATSQIMAMFNAACAMERLAA